MATARSSKAGSTSIDGSSGKQLSFHGRALSRIGFGCWQLAGDYEFEGHAKGYGTINRAEAVRAIHHALDNGINFFDTAVAYGFGASESLLGAALKSYQATAGAEPVVCTKFGIDLSDPRHVDFSAINFVKSVEGSLKRLQRNELDIVLLHNPPDDFDFSVIDVASFERMIEAGKIRAYGVSCRTFRGVANVLQHQFGSVIEAVYNPLDRRFERHFSDSRYKDAYLFICRVPLASGFLVPRTLLAERTFPPNDIRNYFASEKVEWLTSAVRKLSFLDHLEGGMVVSALRFQLSNRHNSVAIPGMKNTKQVNDAILALRLGPLSADVIARINDAVPEVFYQWR